MKRFVTNRGGNMTNITAHIRHEWKKTTVLSCHRCLIRLVLKNWTTIRHRY